MSSSLQMITDLIARSRREAALVQQLTALAGKAGIIPWIFDTTPNQVRLQLLAMAEEARQERDRLMQQLGGLS
jgi:hypothetical protein